MNSSDLRVGNWVQYNYFPMYVVAVYQDGTVYCDFEGNEGDVWEFDKNNPCEGIELTEEILLKCGFEYIDSKIKGNKKILSIDIYNNDSIDFELNEFFIAGIAGHRKLELFNQPKYLHQLQNLFHIMTNEELQVEL